MGCKGGALWNERGVPPRFKPLPAFEVDCERIDPPVAVATIDAWKGLEWGSHTVTTPPRHAALQEKNVTFSARLTKMETKMYQSFNGTGAVLRALAVCSVCVCWGGGGAGCAGHRHWQAGGA